MQHLFCLKKLCIVGLLALLFPGIEAFAAGAYLVQGGTVKKVGSTNANATSFVIQVSGGSVNTCGSTWINFNQADAPDAATFARAYASALLALTSQTPVVIFNYFDTTCQRAGYIELDQS